MTEKETIGARIADKRALKEHRMYTPIELTDICKDLGLQYMEVDSDAVTIIYYETENDC